MTRRRAAVAGVFAVLYPGLGHVYLREWLRALTWFGLALLTAAIVVPADVLSTVEAGGLATLLEASRSLPFASLVALLMVRLLNVVDAVWLGLAPEPTATEDGESCPACGGELDPELEFCHWCTTRLDHVTEGSAEGEGFLP